MCISFLLLCLVDVFDYIRLALIKLFALALVPVLDWPEVSTYAAVYLRFGSTLSHVLYLLPPTYCNSTARACPLPESA